MFWHSSAHVLGESAERHYGCHLCIGPPTDDGFFYEMAIEDRPVTTADYPALEKLSELAVKDKQKFERIVVPKETLLKMFEVCDAFQGLSAVLNLVYSIINTNNTSSRPKFRMGPPPLYIDAVP